MIYRFGLYQHPWLASSSTLDLSVEVQSQERTRGPSEQLSNTGGGGKVGWFSLLRTETELGERLGEFISLTGSRYEAVLRWLRRERTEILSFLNDLIGGTVHHFDDLKIYLLQLPGYNPLFTKEYLCQQWRFPRLWYSNIWERIPLCYRYSGDTRLYYSLPHWLHRPFSHSHLMEIRFSRWIWEAQ